MKEAVKEAMKKTKNQSKQNKKEEKQLSLYSSPFLLRCILCALAASALFSLSAAWGCNQHPGMNHQEWAEKVAAFTKAYNEKQKIENTTNTVATEASLNREEKEEQGLKNKQEKNRKEKRNSASLSTGGDIVRKPSQEIRSFFPY